MRGKGPTPAEAFEGAATALSSIMVDIDKIDPDKSIEIELENEDLEDLLVDWLSELLYLFDVEELVFKDFEVNIDKNRLTATAKGERFNPEKHGSGTVVKAITYNELKVEKQKDKWIAQCVVDV